MAISRLTGQDATGSGAPTAASATYASTPTANNLLICVTGDTDGLGGNIPTLTGITGWTNFINTEASASTNLNIFYKIATGSETTTVTATNSNAVAMDLAIFEFTGLVTSLVLDQSATGGGTSLAANTGTTAATTVANELLIGAAFWSVGATQSGPSWSNSFTGIASVGSHLFVGQNIVAVTGTQTTTVTVTGTSTSWAAGIGTFKGATVISSPTPPNSNLSTLNCG